MSWIIKRARFSWAPRLQHSTHLATSLGKILNRKYICCAYIKSTIKIVGCRKNISHCHCFRGAAYEPSKALSHEIHNGDKWGRPWWMLSAAPTPPPPLSVPPRCCLMKRTGFWLLVQLLPAGAAHESCLSPVVQVRLDPCRGQQGQEPALGTRSRIHGAKHRRSFKSVMGRVGYPEQELTTGQLRR